MFCMHVCMENKMMLNCAKNSQLSIIPILKVVMFSLLHLECHLISIPNLNLFGLFSTERGNRDLAN